MQDGAPIENMLLTKILTDKDFASLQKSQITEDFFVTPECKEVFCYIRDIYFGGTTSGHIPSLELVQKQFASFYAYSSPDSIPILCLQLRNQKIRLELLTLGHRIIQEADYDPATALASLRTGSSTLSSLAEAGQDLSISGAYQQLLSSYELTQNSQGMLGIPYPWAPLNEVTQGKQPGQFIVLYGRPKSLKSWLAVHNAVHDYIVARRRVLFYTCEMSPFMLSQRVAACISGVDYAQFKAGKLQPELKERTFQILKDLAEDEKYADSANSRGPFIRFMSSKSARSGNNGGGVGWLRAKIEELDPDIVYVDGMYLMKDDRSGTRSVDWKAMSHISQDLKIACTDYEIPIIGVTQANRNAQNSTGEDLTELSFSDSLGQDADAVFRVTKHERITESGAKFNELYLKAPGLREAKFEGIVIGGDPAYDFTFKRMMTEEMEGPPQGGRGGGGQGGNSHGERMSRRITPSIDPRIPIRR
jgi:replicative DNA helicase